MSSNKLNLYKAYKALKEAGRRDGFLDDKRLAELADTSYWEALKEAVIIPKISSLLIMADDVSAVLKGEETLEEFGFKSIAARLAAGHLQDIVDWVEQTSEVVTANKKRGGEKK